MRATSNPRHLIDHIEGYHKETETRDPNKFHGIKHFSSSPSRKVFFGAQNTDINEILQNERRKYEQIDPDLNTDQSMLQLESDYNNDYMNRKSSAVSMKNQI